MVMLYTSIDGVQTAVPGNTNTFVSVTGSGTNDITTYGYTIIHTVNSITDSIATTGTLTIITVATYTGNLVCVITDTNIAKSGTLNNVYYYYCCYWYTTVIRYTNY